MGKVGSIFDLMEAYAKSQSSKLDKHRISTLQLALAKLTHHKVNYDDVEFYIGISKNLDISDIFLNIVSSKKVEKTNLLYDVIQINPIAFNKHSISYKSLYHNELRITPKPSYVEYDINTGEINRIEEDYFLEYKFSYTLDDLLNYYLSKKYLCNKHTVDKKRFLMHLKDLVNRYKLEDVLFMIDASEDHLASIQYKTLNNPYGIVDYYNQAMNLKEKKISEIKANGSDLIVPRKRLLLN